MKKGFTLAELLVTVGVIGVVAALAMVGMTKMLPDKNKPLVLKKYNEISELTNQLLSNPLLYKPNLNQLENNRPATLSNGDKPTDMRYQENVYSEGSKYAYLLADAYGVKRGDVNCHDLFCSFTVSDGTKIDIEQILFRDDIPLGRQARLFINLPNAKPEQICVYGNEGCSDPARYEFRVLFNGNVEPVDPLSQAYVQNAKNLNNKKEDFKLAKDIKDGKNTGTVVPTQDGVGDQGGTNEPELEGDLPETLPWGEGKEKSPENVINGDVERELGKVISR